MKKSNDRVRNLTLTALLLALSIVLGRFFLIPIPWTHGYLNLCDVGIIIAAMLLGPLYGTFVGGCGGLFLDILSGYSQYAIFSLIAHGLEGLAIGYFYGQAKKRKVYQWLSLALGVFIMTLSYFFSDSFMYDSWIVGFLGIGGNFLQGAIGAAISMWIVPYLEKRIS